MFLSSNDSSSNVICHWITRSNTELGTGVSRPEIAIAGLEQLGIRLTIRLSKLGSFYVPNLTPKGPYGSVSQPPGRVQYQDLETISPGLRTLLKFKMYQKIHSKQVFVNKKTLLQNLLPGQLTAKHFTGTWSRKGWEPLPYGTVQTELGFSIVFQVCRTRNFSNLIGYSSRKVGFLFSSFDNCIVEKCRVRC